MNLLDILTGQRAYHAFTFFLVNTAQQNHLTARLFEQVRDIAADGDDGNVFLIGKRARQKGIAAAVFNKDGLAVVHQGRGKFRQFTFERVVIHHARLHVIAVQRDSISVRATQVALFFQQIKILTDGDFRNASGFSEIDYAYASLIDDHLQNELLSGIHSIHLIKRNEVGDGGIKLPTALLAVCFQARCQHHSEQEVQTSGSRDYG